MTSEQRNRLRAELASIAEATRQFDYIPGRFLADLERNEPDELISTYVLNPKVSDGFTRLFMERRLDLTVENIAWKNRDLLPEHIVRAARARLEQAEFDVEAQVQRHPGWRPKREETDSTTAVEAVLPRIFATRVWGFTPAYWPVITFGLEGNRDALVRASQAGDLVLFIGTETPETAPEEQGRLLGLATIGRHFAVDTLDAVDPTILNRAHYNENGQFRWPKALAMLRAWRFTPPPRVLEVLKQQLTYEATVRAVLLDEDDTRAVHALAKEEVPVRDYPAVKRLRGLAEGGASAVLLLLRGVK